jgi:hypothetical protein
VENILHSAYHREMRHGGRKKAGRIGEKGKGNR